jgi:hypothetical protein
LSYTYNYINLVNRVLSDFNEVLLTEATFPTAVGFQGVVKNYVNDALNDIYTWEDVVWPFLWTQKTFTTTISQGTYTVDPSVLNTDWDTFNIIRQPIPVTSITNVAGLVTVTVNTGHQLLTGHGDNVTVLGATPADYNGVWTPVIVSNTVFTYAIPNTSAANPTGSITIIPPYSNYYLTLKNYDEYLRDWRDVDVNANQQYLTYQSPSAPRFVVRKPDNNFILSPYPDRIYTVGYDAYINPDSAALTNSSDIPLVPSVFRQVIIDRAGVYCLAFRDNDTQLVRNDQKFEDNVHRMRRIIIKQSEYLVAKN